MTLEERVKKLLTNGYVFQEEKRRFAKGIYTMDMDVVQYGTDEVFNRFLNTNKSIKQWQNNKK